MNVMIIQETINLETSLLSWIENIWDDYVYSLKYLIST